MNVKRHLSTYQASDINTGIVHIGLGAFMRAHLAVYTESVLNQHGGDWGICAVNIRSNYKLVDILREQNCLYHVSEYQNAEEVCLREISALREVMFAGADDSKTLLTRLQDLRIKIVSLSITEKGYYLNPADGSFLRDHNNILYDLQHPHGPKTAIGIIVAALKFRYDHDLPGFTLLSCDNMPNNGVALKSAVKQFAAINNAELVTWIEHTVASPSSMVDRIVPAVTPESLAEINILLNTHENDAAAVACESFSQWVIEDDFPQGRPDWNLAGAEFVSEVAPYETMKLRLLNGSHSLLAYLGCLSNLIYVADCMQQPEFVALIKHYMLVEAIPTLSMPVGVDLIRYVDSLLTRFSNDSLRHKTQQIAMDGSQKIPQRWLNGIDILLSTNVEPKVGALGLAAWMLYVGGSDHHGHKFIISDPMAAELADIYANYSNPGERLEKLLQTSIFAGTCLVKNSRFIELTFYFYQQLADIGARETIKNLVQDF